MRRRRTRQIRFWHRWKPVYLLRRLLSQRLRLLGASKWRGIHLITLLVMVLSFILILNFSNLVMQSARLEEQRLSLAAELELLQVETDRLQGEAEYEESDANIERVAREQLGYARDGDIVILPQVPLLTPTPTVFEPTPLPLPEAPPNWQRWWFSFFSTPTK